MAHTIIADGNWTINLAPETVVEEVLQNILMIVSTLKNTVPLYRDFGISAEFLDKSTPIAETMIIAEIYDAIEKYEIRAEITNIYFERDERAGKLIPRLEVEIIE